MLCAGVGGGCQSADDGQKETGNSLKAFFINNHKQREKYAQHTVIVTIYCYIAAQIRFLRLIWRTKKIFQ
jgi:hypothetical protein